jgi:hypothetical protein
VALPAEKKDKAFYVDLVVKTQAKIKGSASLPSLAALEQMNKQQLKGWLTEHDVRSIDSGARSVLLSSFVAQAELPAAAAKKEEYLALAKSVLEVRVLCSRRFVSVFVLPQGQGRWCSCARCSVRGSCWRWRCLVCARQPRPQLAGSRAGRCLLALSLIGGRSGRRRGWRG